MEHLYEEAMNVAEQLKSARLNAASFSLELTKIEYQLHVVQAQVERALIKKVGDEKKLGPTTDSRERIFVLARDANPTFVSLKARVADMTAQLDAAQIEVKYLQDKLKILLTALKTDTL